MTQLRVTAAQYRAMVGADPASPAKARRIISGTRRRMGAKEDAPAVTETPGGRPIPWKGTDMAEGTSPVHLVSESDRELVLARLRGLVAQEVTQVWVTAHPGPPVSKSRARWSAKTGKFYTPGSTDTAQTAMAWEMKAAMGGVKLLGAVAVVVTFYRPNFQRIDIDNLTKLVMDAATEAEVWVDDCHVVAQAAVMELDIENPRTIVAFGVVKSTMDRSARFTCTVCGKAFTRAGLAALKRPPKTCSRECRDELYRRDRGEARCPCCEAIFQRRVAGQRYCGRPCADRWARGNPPGPRSKPICLTCGGPTSSRAVVRCVKCAPKGRPKGSKNKEGYYQRNAIPKDLCEQIASEWGPRGVGGLTAKALGEKYGLSPFTVRGICQRYRPELMQKNGSKRYESQEASASA